jgi:outer membrane protein TolC
MKSIIKSISIGLAASVFTIFTTSAQHKLSLQEAVNLALKNNPDIAAGMLETEKARQQKIIARSLFLPSINATAQVNHYFQLNPFFGFGENTSGGKIPYGRFGGEDQLGAYVTAVQPLYNPQALPSLKHAGLKESESQLVLEAERVNTLSAVKQTYLQILVLKERIKLQHESINRNERVLKDSRSLFIQGKGLRVDTLRAYTAVRNLEPHLLKLNFAIETGKLQLKTLIGDR